MNVNEIAREIVREIEVIAEGMMALEGPAELLMMGEVVAEMMIAVNHHTDVREIGDDEALKRVYYVSDGWRHIPSVF